MGFLRRSQSNRVLPSRHRQLVSGICRTFNGSLAAANANARSQFRRAEQSIRFQHQLGQRPDGGGGSLHGSGQSDLVSGGNQHIDWWFVLFQRSRLDKSSWTFLPPAVAVKMWFATRFSGRPGFFRVLQLLVIVYLLIVLAALIFQRRLIYFPTKIPTSRVVQAAAEHGFVPWKNPAGQIIGWKIPAASSPVASVLITHGNAGCAIDRGYLANPIHVAAPVDIYVLEYPGYGSREGSP